MKKIILIALLAVLLNSCEKESRECPGAVEQNFPLSGFSRINAGGTFRITITKGTDFSVKASGCADDLADLDLAVSSGNTLDIKYNEYKPNRYRVDFNISLPQLTSVNLSGKAKGTVSGFQGQTSVIRHILSGGAECLVNGTGINAQLELSGEAVLNIIGITENLYGSLSGDARLNAYETTATEVDISASGTSKAFVKPTQNFFAEASGESRVYYRGNPPVKQFVTSGNARIIQQ